MFHFARSNYEMMCVEQLRLRYGKEWERVGRFFEEKDLVCELILKEHQEN